MKNRNLFTLIPKVDELLDKESTKIVRTYTS